MLLPRRLSRWNAPVALLLGAFLGLTPTAPCPAQGNPALAPPSPSPAAARLRFRVAFGSELAASGTTGRLLVVLGPTNGAMEPRHSLGHTGLEAPPFLAIDVTNFSAGEVIELGRLQALFPLSSLDLLSPDSYRVQAVLCTNRDLRLFDAPGNFYSVPMIRSLQPSDSEPVPLRLARREPEETPPPDLNSVRFIKLRSQRLTEFHGRPLFLRAAVSLPRSFETEPTRRYPLLIMTGGYGTRFTALTNELAAGQRLFRAQAEGPEFLLLQLDGAGPFGDPYQVNSANNGPYGDALTQELIPYVEQVFRGIGLPHSRILSGGSTGGWVSLALQIFYPDYFGGCWAGFPDSPDFRAFQLLNVYQDTNAYLNSSGFERPSNRFPNGDVRYSMRHELQLENALGADNCYAQSGQQWGAWNAVYSPRGSDGAPLPLWHPRSGKIDPKVAAAWREYDLRILLDRHWTHLAPRLRGKIHAWVGTADDYFLDGGLRSFAQSIESRTPALEASIRFEPGAAHGWEPQTFLERLREIQAYIDSRAPKTAEAAREALLRSKMGHGPACPHCRGSR